ncbi:excisionase family DNA binding protein [Dyadobacter sp. BE34]|uniref:Excisionase family DNA binding protein n=1 Tax=Dyadobacter fermentans TaxID=94254 RepID=A0ABU1QWP0_9BACT|nr:MULTISPECIES: helix-turn-helix domain-containing protein [Dyadobacter]MDR6805546.1 excisionase family DNA binding protein [Dyadobacter fermentans]MDR7042694.1 excisionase family DNA binding protein [Dyadobacter sp. BE242]MDR7197006.1 excisionase family DNA binding protein [Dyadobacter sp. BE34]MDR7215559.1 excisionase family DNA binding protein [Dyadobacter sp. BE31]MDR7263095.1 excisionase family DNA binding protein [Dyadobacter sp. BE32]
MSNILDEIVSRLDNFGQKLDRAIESRQNEHGLDKFQFVRVEEAAGILGVSIPTIRLYTSKQKLRHYKRGHYVYYKIDDLNDFVEKGRREPSRR